MSQIVKTVEYFIEAYLRKSKSKPNYRWWAPSFAALKLKHRNLYVNINNSPTLVTRQIKTYFSGSTFVY